MRLLGLYYWRGKASRMNIRHPHTMQKLSNTIKLIIFNEARLNDRQRRIIIKIAVDLARNAARGIRGFETTD